MNFNEEDQKKYIENLKFTKGILKQIAIWNSVSINNLFLKLQNKKEKIEINDENLTATEIQELEELEDKEQITEFKYLKKINLHQHELCVTVDTMKAIDYLLSKNETKF